MKPIPRVAQPIPRPQRLRLLPLRPVHMGRPDQGPPACDRVGSRKGERDARPRGGVPDEAREVEPALVGGVEVRRGLVGEEEFAGPDDLWERGISGWEGGGVIGGCSTSRPDCLIAWRTSVERQDYLLAAQSR